MPMIDLVADVGESFGAYRLGDDEQILDLLTSANVACGFHAGDPSVMAETVEACRSRGVGVGAHPGFDDLRGFGRRPLAMSEREVKLDVLYQIGALAAIANSTGVPLTHVTPHGSLGNLSVTDPLYAKGVLAAVQDFDNTLPIVTQEGFLADLAREAGVPVAITAMADRAYNPDGSLVSRNLPGAVIDDPDETTERAVRMVVERSVVAISGEVVQLDAATVLLHGDSSDSIAVARKVRAGLETAGIEIAPLSVVLDEKAAADG